MYHTSGKFIKESLVTYAHSGFQNKLIRFFLVQYLHLFYLCNDNSYQPFKRLKT